MSKLRHPRRPLSFFLLYLGVDPSESVVLHLPVAHDETPRQIAIAIMTINLLYFHIVSCRNLQLLMK